jgi:pentatricopeptide repeat protein
MWQHPKVMWIVWKNANVLSWNALVERYAKNGPINEALETIKQMQLAGVKLNSKGFISILPICAIMGTLEQVMERNFSKGKSYIIWKILCKHKNIFIVSWWVPPNKEGLWKKPKVRVGKNYSNPIWIEKQWQQNNLIRICRHH